MPWRVEPRNPYAVWVSEVMLQQTRVVSVVPYFARFMTLFPDVSALARAPIEQVLGAWSGLGYYRRARSLHDAACVVEQRFDGRLPGTLEELRSLPGIGPYTAAAIGSIAFGLPVAVVDGNVQRVVCRVFGIDSPLEQKQTGQRIALEADRLLDRRAPGRSNEAMMDLGAVVCTPRNPACLACPLERGCVARRQGREGELPFKAPKRASPRVPMAAFVVIWGDHALFLRRRTEGLFGGLWEPPMLRGSAGEAKRSALVCAMNISRWRRRGRLEHVLTHRVLDVTVFSAHTEAPLQLAPSSFPSDYEAIGWWSADEASARGLSTLARKVLEIGWRAEARGAGGTKAAQRSSDRGSDAESSGRGAT